MIACFALMIDRCADRCAELVIDVPNWRSMCRIGSVSGACPTTHSFGGFFFFFFFLYENLNQGQTCGHADGEVLSRGLSRIDERHSLRWRCSFSGSWREVVPAHAPWGDTPGLGGEMMVGFGLMAVDRVPSPTALCEALALD